MRILIATKEFPPRRNARAFRSFELVRELAERGHKVDVILPEGSKVDDINITPIYIKDRILPNRGYEERKKNNFFIIYQRLLRFVKTPIRLLIAYLTGTSLNSLLYGWRIHKFLSQKKEYYEMVIGISFDFYVLVGLAMAEKRDLAKVWVADCGDPFYDNPANNMPRHIFYLERWVLRHFDFVTIPIKEARKSYLSYLSSDKIRIIPQGFRLPDTSRNLYRKNMIPTFCYAGVFYEKIRNPKFFFDYLLRLQLKKAFRFVVYARNDPFTQAVLTDYQKLLGEKLEVHTEIDRDVLLPILATMDFVVNFDNDNINQRPSKLIDYAMSHRPILSFNQSTFKAEIFERFLDGDYRNQFKIDLKQYDIRTVADQFEILYYEHINGNRI